MLIRYFCFNFLFIVFFLFVALCYLCLCLCRFSLQQNSHLNGKTVLNSIQSSQPISAPTQSLPVSNQLTISQCATAIATATATSTSTANTLQFSMPKAAVTTSPNATCTSLNDDNKNNNNNNNNNNIRNICDQQKTDHKQHQLQQQKLTFTILITIEKSQHLCVIDLISQSLKLLTRHVAYCELLAICLDTNLLPTSNKTVYDSDTNSNEINNATNPTDSNGNHCSGNSKVKFP